MRLAHFSDLHVTHTPSQMPLREWRLKRLLNAVSYYPAGRHWRFRDNERRISELLADAQAQHPDYMLCTGDLTATSLDSELASAARLFAPYDCTIIPGNHDRYVPSALGKFEQYFGTRTYPYVQQWSEGVTLVCLDVVRPTSIVDSRGFCGEPQLQALRDLLPGLRGQFVILALHYGLLQSNGERDTRTHRLEDDEALLAILDDVELPIDLVLHGHLHMPFVLGRHQRQIICVGSGTDLHRPCGYNLYDIDAAAKTVRIERRSYTPTGYISGDITCLSTLPPGRGRA